MLEKQVSSIGESISDKVSVQESFIHKFTLKHEIIRVTKRQKIVDNNEAVQETEDDKDDDIRQQLKQESQKMASAEAVSAEPVELKELIFKDSISKQYESHESFNYKPYYNFLKNF